MPRFRAAYPPEFRRQIVELGRSGRTPEELQREFEPTAQSIANWFRQADRDAGKRSDGATESQRRPAGRVGPRSNGLNADGKSTQSDNYRCFSSLMVAPRTWLDRERCAAAPNSRISCSRSVSGAGIFATNSRTFIARARSLPFPVCSSSLA